jgi:thiamine kinase-like enzyme
MAQTTSVKPSHPRLEEFRGWLAGSHLPPALAAARKLRWRWLAGSAVNLRVRVTGETAAGERHWFVRFAGRDSAALGAQLTAEATAHRAAAAAGLAPSLVHVDEAMGILVSDWWPGQPWRWRQARRGIEAFSTLVARLHAIPVPLELPALHPVTAVRQLLAELPPWQGAETLKNAAHRAMLNALECASRPTEENITAPNVTGIPSPNAAVSAPVLVHSDPHAGNILQSVDGSLCLVDFEYAGAGARVHDLAVFATSHDLTGQQRQALLASYAAAGGGTIGHHELQLACGVADALWLAWILRVHGAAWPQVPRARRVTARLAALS